MAKVQSNMLPLGSLAPHFSLTDVQTDSIINFGNQKNHLATVIMFICNHCPFVKHINSELTSLANDYQSKNILFIAINSNDVTAYPDDAPIHMKAVAKEFKYPFPYVFDETQEVAKAYKAACTPDFYVFNQDLQLVYRGQLDDSRPGNQEPVNGHSIRNALDALLQGEVPSTQQKPSIGCNIKWKN